MADLKEARVPDIGGYDDVPVIEVLVSVGDRVDKDQGLLTLESDKATMEVPAAFAGTVRELRVKEGDRVSQDTVVAMIEPDAADGAPAQAAPAAASKAEAPKPQASAPAPSGPSAAPAAGTPDAGASAGVQDAAVPDIGGQDDVPVIEVLVAVGDHVEKDQGLVTLESDKATMEVPAPFAGTVVELTVKVGDTVSAGSVVARIEGQGGVTATADRGPAQPQAQAPEEVVAASTEQTAPVDDDGLAVVLEALVRDA